MSTSTTESMISIISTSNSSNENSTSVTFKPFLNPVTKAKIGMAVGLLVTVFIVTIFPVILVRYFAKRWNLYSLENRSTYNKFRLWMSRINCFAGGVFLSTGFMDIFPEMLEAIEDAETKNNFKTSFPLGPFVTLCGFFFILIVEESVTFFRQVCCSRTKKSKISNQAIPYNTFGNENTINDDELKVGDDPMNIQASLSPSSSSHHDHDHDHGLDADLLSKGNLTVTILMIAISVHSIFEGLALGLEHDSIGASRLFLALCLHKYVIAVTIGLQICNSTLSMKMAFFCAGIFAFATPFGVVLGFWVNYLEQIGITSFSIVAAILQGMACGTFFYVVFFEILPEEFAIRKDKWPRILALILGFVLISLVMYFVHE